MRLSGFEAIVGVVTGQGWGDFRWLKQAAARIRGIAVATRLKLDGSMCRPRRIQANVQARMASRSVPDTFVGGVK